MIPIAAKLREAADRWPRLIGWLPPRPQRPEPEPEPEPELPPAAAAAIDRIEDDTALAIARIRAGREA